MKVFELEFQVKDICDDKLYFCNTEFGKITVLNRETGIMADAPVRDIETGFRDNDNRMWIASGMFDIREWPDKTIEEAIEWIKENSNILQGDLL